MIVEGELPLGTCTDCGKAEDKSLREFEQLKRWNERKNKHGQSETPKLEMPTVSKDLQSELPMAQPESERDEYWK